MLDIIEIDGASNNWVENVRELIERARFEPNQGKYKIYIIDEVHMLSTGAFNALLKILEEPPKHVKFILATTEIDKVPETIRSRTLRFDFRKITLDDITSRLQYVGKAEGVKVESDAIRIIAKAARGWLRDALTLFEQNIIDSEVSAEHVRHTLSLVEESLIEECSDALVWGDISEIQKIIENLRERHVQVRSFFDQMMYHQRDRMVENIDNANFRIYSDILSMFEESYGKIRILPDGMMLIELTLLRITKRGSESETVRLPISSEMTWKTQEVKKEARVKEVTISETKGSTEKEEIREIESPPAQDRKDGVQVHSVPNEQTSSPAPTSFSFPALVHHLRSTSPALTTDLKTARFELDGNSLKLIFSKKWNYDRVDTVIVRNTITEACSGLFEGVWEVKCELREWADMNISEGVF
jgi:DNA polymerase III subunit gamma/tau